MSKHSSLVKQIEAFEKLAKFGSRVDFLQSLAQENVSGPLGAAVTVLITKIRNWISTNGEKQVDVPGSPQGLPSGVRDPVQVILGLAQKATKNNRVDPASAGNDEYDLNDLSQLKTAIKNLLNVSNLGNLGASAKNNWMQNVFPQASYVADLIDSQMRFLNAYRSQNSALMTSENKPVAQSTPATAPTAGKPQKLNQMSKAVSKALVNKISQLSDGPERANQLKEIDLGVKTLQNYFRRLQNSNVLNDYLARVDIVSALNKAYNSLDQNDLKTVVSLSPDGAGGGVPESPDSKI